MTGPTGKGVPHVKRWGMGYMYKAQLLVLLRLLRTKCQYLEASKVSFRVLLKEVIKKEVTKTLKPCANRSHLGV